MNSKAFALTVLVCMLLIATWDGRLESVDAVLLERVAGVKAGQWIKYGGFLALWASEVPTASPTLDLLDVNNTDWIVHTVQSVSGTLVTFEALTHYKNGSEISSVRDVDVDSGSGRGNMSFVSAGLSVYDRVYTTGELAAARVNSTSLRGYAGVFRETSLLNATVTSEGLDTVSAYWTEYFWDKLTGVMVRQFWSLAHINEEGYLTLASIEYEMVDNNTWLDATDSVAPVAAAGSDLVVDQGANVTFDGGGSSDNVGIIDFIWDFGDGSSGSGLRVFHIFDKAGVYDVTVTVKDVGGYSANDVLVVTVSEAVVDGPWPWLVPIAVSALVVLLVLAWILLRRHARPRVRQHERRKRV